MADDATATANKNGELAEVLANQAKKAPGSPGGREERLVLAELLASRVTFKSFSKSFCHFRDTQTTHCVHVKAQAKTITACYLNLTEQKKIKQQLVPHGLNLKTVCSDMKELLTCGEADFNPDHLREMSLTSLKLVYAWYERHPDSAATCKEIAEAFECSDSNINDTFRDCEAGVEEMTRMEQRESLQQNKSTLLEVPATPHETSYRTLETLLSSSPMEVNDVNQAHNERGMSQGDAAVFVAMEAPDLSSTVMNEPCASNTSPQSLSAGAQEVLLAGDSILTPTDLNQNDLMTNAAFSKVVAPGSLACDDHTQRKRKLQYSGIEEQVVKSICAPAITVSRAPNGGSVLDKRYLENHDAALLKHSAELLKKTDAMYSSISSSSPSSLSSQPSQTIRKPSQRSQPSQQTQIPSTLKSSVAARARFQSLPTSKAPTSNQAAATSRTGTGPAALKAIQTEARRPISSPSATDSTLKRRSSVVVKEVSGKLVHPAVKKLQKPSAAGLGTPGCLHANPNSPVTADLQMVLTGTTGGDFDDMSELTAAQRALYD